jgi:DNA-binding GntR family transcriptional regulator
MILSAELAPGSKLTEVALAARLGVSRGRCAKRSGCSRKPVWCAPRRTAASSCATSRSRSDRDLRPARGDGRAGRPAPRESITPAALREVRGLVDSMEQAVKAKDAYNYHLLNLKFHDRLVELAGNGKLTAIYRKLIKELSLFRRMNLADGWLMPISAGEHRRSSRRSHRATPKPPARRCSIT